MYVNNLLSAGWCFMCGGLECGKVRDGNFYVVFSIQAREKVNSTHKTHFSLALIPSSLLPQSPLFIITHLPISSLSDLPTHTLSTILTNTTVHDHQSKWEITESIRNTNPVQRRPFPISSTLSPITFISSLTLLGIPCNKKFLSLQNLRIF